MVYTGNSTQSDYDAVADWMCSVDIQADGPPDEPRDRDGKWTKGGEQPNNKEKVDRGVGNAAQELKKMGWKLVGKGLLDGKAVKLFNHPTKGSIIVSLVSFKHFNNAGVFVAQQKVHSAYWNQTGEKGLNLAQKLSRYLQEIDKPKVEAPPAGAPAANNIAIREQKLSGEVVKIKNLGGGINVTKVVTLDNGSKAVYKPSRFFADTSTANELAAWEVAKLVGMEDMLGATVIRGVKGVNEHGKEGSDQKSKGAVIEWRDGDVAMNFHDDIKYDGARDLERAAIFDYALGNADRHTGNWLVTPKGKLQLIDHGLIFNYPSSKFISRLQQTTVKPEISKDLVAPYVKNSQAISETLSRIGIVPQAIATMIKRINKLNETQRWYDL